MFVPRPPQVKFVRIDARCEWLCLSSVKQAENLWVNQLLHSKDVVAQAEAVTGARVAFAPGVTVHGYDSAPGGL
eukprot:scaffold87763_cov26-Tisochrysis_lutea.AAC.2